jgi:hypothetical protein
LNQGNRDTIPSGSNGSNCSCKSAATDTEVGLQVPTLEVARGHSWLSADLFVDDTSWRHSGSNKIRGQYQRNKERR